MQNVVGRVIVIVALLLLPVAEIGLRIVELTGGARVEAAAPNWSFLLDSRLGMRLTPSIRGSDSRGFRNEANNVVQHADIVALGDSVTWGVNARSPRETWPGVLETLTHSRIYNMAVPGYGPVQYAALLSDALTLTPSTVVVGLYFGNDLYDAYSFTYDQQINPALKNTEGLDLFSNDTLRPTVTALENDWVNNTSFAPMSLNTVVANLPSRLAIARWARANGLMDSVEDRFERDASRAWVAARPVDAALYEHAGVLTAFTLSYRLLAVDLDEPRIAEGLRITRVLLDQMQTQAGQAGTRIVIALLPTKELVYADAMVQQTGPLGPKYARLVGMERRARANILDLCAQRNLECVDTLPTLQDAVTRDEQIYPPNPDGHPGERGYALIAADVARALGY